MDLVIEQRAECVVPLESLPLKIVAVPAGERVGEDRRNRPRGTGAAKARRPAGIEKMLGIYDLAQFTPPA